MYICLANILIPNAIDLFELVHANYKWMELQDYCYLIPNATRHYMKNLLREHPPHYRGG